MSYKDELDGCFNVIADNYPFNLVTWSDCNLNSTTFDCQAFDKLQCRNCQGEMFEVFKTGSFETSARCVKCKMWYIAHSG